MSLRFASIEVFIQFPFSFIDCLVQVMGFLLKVKRAKFALDKARRWMWKVLFFIIIFLTCYPGYGYSFIDESIQLQSPDKEIYSLKGHEYNVIVTVLQLGYCSDLFQGRGNATNSRKHHWLVEQKLLHFVDAFHQYVMDRVRIFSMPG